METEYSMKTMIVLKPQELQNSMVVLIQITMGLWIPKMIVQKLLELQNSMVVLTQITMD